MPESTKTNTLTQQRPQSGGRVDWLDVARGICILLVIVGHDGYIPLTLRHFIYTFHMPLFFFCSGLFIHRSLELSFPAFLRQKAKNYLLPYFAYELLYYLVYPLVKLLLINISSVFAFLIKNHDCAPDVNSLLAVFIQCPGSRFENEIWFFTALFVVNVIFYLAYHFCKKHEKLKLPVLAALLTAAAFVYIKIAGVNLIWYLDVACIVLPYMLLGYYANIYGMDRIESRMNWKTGLGAFVLCGALAYLHYLFTGDSMDYHLGKVDELFTAYASGAAGIFFVCCLSKALSKSRLLSFIGVYSMFYYLFDWVGRRVVDRLILLSGLSFGNTAILIFHLIGSALVTVPIVLVIRRYFYFLFGLKKYRKPEKVKKA